MPLNPLPPLIFIFINYSQKQLLKPLHLQEILTKNPIFEFQNYESLHAFQTNKLNRFSRLYEYYLLKHFECNHNSLI